jgi:Ca-activated chloride channel family protein
MSCQDVQERLTDALLGETPPSVREELLDHAAGCSGCAEAAEQLRQTLELLRGSSWPAETVLGDAERRRLFERARAPRTPIRWIAAAASLAAVAVAAGVGVPALQRARREPVPPEPPPTVVEAVPSVRPTPAPAATRPPEVRTPPPAPPPEPAPTPAPVVVAAREPVVPSRPRDVPPAGPRRFLAEEPDPVARREDGRRTPLETARAPEVAILGATATEGWTPSARGRTSRFGFDVGNSSFALVREALLDGRLPDPSAVHVEEFVNAVPGGEPAPESQTFAVGLEAARSPFDPSLAYLRVGVRAREVARGDRRAVRLVFVVDLSESMGDRLALLKRNLRRLAERLDGADSLALVAYGAPARVVLAPTPGDDREGLLQAIAGLEPEGSADAGEALQIGYGLASSAFEFGAVNRVVLCTDGFDHATGGDTGSLLGQVRGRAAGGIELAVLGLGLRGDGALQRLALDGRGPYASVAGDADLGRFLLRDLTQLEGIVARNARVEVEFDPARVRAYRLLGHQAAAFAPSGAFRPEAAAAASDVHGGQAVTALYELRVSPGDGALGTVRVRFEPSETPAADEVSRAIHFARDWAFDDASGVLQLTVLAGRFAEHLRQERPHEPFRLLHETAQRARPRVSSLDRDLEILPMIRAAGRLLGVRE